MANEDQDSKLLEKYKIFRDYIEHEDSLINNRLTWLLVSQSLIFNAYSALTKSILDATIANNFEVTKGFKENLEGVQYILGALAMVISIITFMGVKAAVNAIHKIKEKEKLHKFHSQDLPDLTGGGDPDGVNLNIPTALPITIFFAWIFVMSRSYRFLVVIAAGFIIGTTLTTAYYNRGKVCK